MKKKLEENNNLKNHYFQKLKHSESNRLSEKTENEEYIQRLQSSRINLIFSDESEIKSSKEFYAEFYHTEMVNEIFNLNRKVSVQDYDRIIKNKMLSLFPDKDPWKMFENYFKINHQEKDSDLLWEVCKEINQNFEKEEMKSNISKNMKTKSLKSIEKE